MSSEEPQQGDPLGPLLFSNTVQLLLPSLELVLGFLDDFSLGGHQNQVAMRRSADYRGWCPNGT